LIDFEHRRFGNFAAEENNEEDTRLLPGTKEVGTALRTAASGGTCRMICR
jgi:hypothetical protein